MRTCAPNNFKKGIRGPTGPTGPSNGGSGSPADPYNTLFVSPSWNQPYNPATHFTTIQSAVNQATLLTGPVCILISPGNYAENVNLSQANVSLVGVSIATVYIQSLFLSTSTLNTFTNLYINDLTITGANSTTANFTNCYIYGLSGSSNSVNLNMYECFLSNTIQFNEMNVTLINCQTVSSAQLESDSTLTIYSSIIACQTITSSGICEIYQSNIFATTLSFLNIDIEQTTISCSSITFSARAGPFTTSGSITNSSLTTNATIFSGNGYSLYTSNSSVNLGTNNINAPSLSWYSQNCTLIIPPFVSYFFNWTQNDITLSGSNPTIGLISLSEEFFGNQNNWTITATTTDSCFHPQEIWYETNSTFTITSASVPTTIFINGPFVLDGCTMNCLPTITGSFIFTSFSIGATCSARNSIWNISYTLSSSSLININVPTDFSGSVWNFRTSSATSSAIVFSCVNALTMNRCSIYKQNPSITESTFFSIQNALYMSNASINTPSTYPIFINANSSDTTIVVANSTVNIGPTSTFLANAGTSNINILGSIFSTNASYSTGSSDQSLSGEATIVSGTSVNVTFAQPQNDLNYSVIATSATSAITNIYITNKTTTGFTLNSYPSGVGAINWNVVRKIGSIA